MKTGVYQIRNLLNGKIYIGSVAKQYGFQLRWSKHRSDLLKGQHHSIHLQRAWDKYGADAFVFEILEECEPERCIEREQYHLDDLLFSSYNDKRFHQLGYNICRVAGSSLGIKQDDKWIEKRMSKLRGLKRSMKTRQRMSRAAKHRKGESYGFSGKHHSEEAKDKLSIANRGESSWSAKLREYEVRIIKRALRRGIAISKLAQRFNVAACTISNIKAGRKWGYIDG